jgi:hypothetical protein
MKHINQLIVSAITTAIIVACGGAKVSFAPDANAQSADAGTSTIVQPTACECSAVPGPQGPEGHQGPAGVMGPAGASGADGAQGPQGPQGPIGPQGESVRGPAGPTGAPGARGTDGAAGPQGPRGLQGLAGAQGPKGDTGEQGPAIDKSMVYIREMVYLLEPNQSGEITRRVPCESANDVLLSGGCKLASTQGVRLQGSMPTFDEGWECTVNKDLNTSNSMLMHALCLSRD